MSVILALNRGTMLQFCWVFFPHLNYTHSLVFEVWSKEHFIRIGQKKNTLTMEFYLIESNCWLFLCIIHSVCLNLGQTSASTPNKQNKKKTYPRREREAVREIKCNYNGCSKHSMTQYYFFFYFSFLVVFMLKLLFLFWLLNPAGKPRKPMSLDFAMIHFLSDTDPVTIVYRIIDETPYFYKLFVFACFFIE